MSNVQQLHPAPPKPITCSFCNKVKTESLTMIKAASGATICRQCIDKAKVLVKEQK